MKIPIRVTILGLFLFLSAFVLGPIFYIQSNLSEDLAKKAMNDYFKTTTFKVEKNIEVMNAKNIAIANLATTFIQNTPNEDFTKNEELYLKKFANILEDSKTIYSLYLGFSDDRFYEIINLNIHPEVNKRFKIKKTDRWLQIEILNPSIQIVSLFDKDFKLTSKKELKNTYKPTLRPWYKNSINTNQTKKTGPYQFSNINSVGITYSKKVNQNTIFAVDVLVNDFHTIINTKNDIKSLESYLFNKDKMIISSSTNNNKVFDKILSIKKNKDLHTVKQSTIKIENKTYIYDISSIKSDHEKKEYILSYALLEEMKSPYLEKFNIMHQVLLLLGLILLPLMWYFASIIVKPILLLTKESQKVKNREFDKVVQVSSIVTEVGILSRSITSMAKSIHSYQHELEEKVEHRTKELYEKNRQLKILSVTDKLTNTYNRIQLDNTIEKEIQRANRKNSHFGIVIIDIDYFKKVNDTYGHQVGDTVLIEFSNILKQNTRRTDTVGRWGGEEFVIICVEADLQELLSLATILKEKIEKHTFSTVKTKTASFGVATYKKSESAQDLINRADKALYIAKENGRNRVETLEKI